MSGFTIQLGFDEAHRTIAAALYWQAFKGKLQLLMGPDHKARCFFETVMDTKFALCAYGQAGELLGLAGFKTVEGSLSGGTMRDMARTYGWIGGTWRALLLSTLERDVEPGVLLMDGICVDTAARGQGVGTALLSAVKAHAQTLGLDAVRLDVIDNNPRAHALYAREGFEPTGTTHTGPMRHLLGFRVATAMQCRLGNG